MYILIVTAKMNDVDPQAWLADVLTRIAEHFGDVVDGEYGCNGKVMLPDWHTLEEIASSKAEVRRACEPGARRCGSERRPARLMDQRRSSWPFMPSAELCRTAL